MHFFLCIFFLPASLAAKHGPVFSVWRVVFDRMAAVRVFSVIAVCLATVSAAIIGIDMGHDYTKGAYSVQERAASSLTLSVRPTNAYLHVFLPHSPHSWRRFSWQVIRDCSQR